MRTFQKKNYVLTSLKLSAKKSLLVVLFSTFIVSTFNNMYGKDNQLNFSSSNASIINTIESINLKGYFENESDILNWNIQNSNSVAYFTIERSDNEYMNFNEVVSINPMECSKINSINSYTFKCASSNEQSTSYYKVKVTFQDNHTIESDIISVKKTNPVAKLNIYEIKNQNGQITLTFKSPKSQNVTINILNRAGQLIIANNISALEGTNTFTFNSGIATPSEMLIFSLNNQEEQITKKYLLAQAY